MKKKNILFIVLWCVAHYSLLFSMTSSNPQQPNSSESEEIQEEISFDDFGFDIGLPDEHMLEKGSALVKFFEDKVKSAGVSIIVGMINVTQWCEDFTKKWTSREK